MKKNYKEYWKELANSKRNTALHHIQYCALKALYAKSNAKKEIAEALVRRAFSPRDDNNWQEANRAARAAFYCHPIFGLDKSLFFADEAEETRYKDIVFTLSGTNIAANEPDYMFIFVRQDISDEQQAVQAAHATFVAGAKFATNDAEKVNFVLIGVENQAELHKARCALEGREVEYCLFREPDLDDTVTAIASAVLKEHQKRFLKHFKKLQFKR